MSVCFETSPQPGPCGRALIAPAWLDAVQFGETRELRTAGVSSEQAEEDCILPRRCANLYAHSGSPVASPLQARPYFGGRIR